MRKLSFYGIIIFYILAGLNHFVNPEFYYGLIPDYLPWKFEINILSGIIEVTLGILLSVKTTRRCAAIAVILMLLAFIPSHVYFIEIGSCIDGGLCVPEWIGWFRLVVVHPLLIFWAYWAGFKFSK